MALEVVVVGGGTMGLASAWALARRGAKVTVLERFGHVHERGSHGGNTRIIRQAYHEGSGYVPIVQRAEQLWLELEQRGEERLLVRTGLLEFGPAEDPELRAAIDACVANGVRYQIFEPADARERWPFEIPDGFTVCLTPSGGYLRVGPCMDALLREASAAGTVVRHQTAVQSIALGDARPHVVLEGGEIVAGDRIVVAAGAYLAKLLPMLPPYRALRRLLAWTQPRDRALSGALERLPVWGAFLREGFFYGFPLNDEGPGGLKLAVHTAPGRPELDRPVDPDQVERGPAASDLEPLRGFLKRYFPAADAPFSAHCVCLYGATHSWDFLIDRHPADANVVVAGGFSGHGFKFAPAVGELVADLVEHRDATHHEMFAWHSS